MDSLGFHLDHMIMCSKRILEMMSRTFIPNPEFSSFENGDAVAAPASPVTWRGAELYTQSVKGPHAGAGQPLDGFAIPWNSLLLRIRSLNMFCGLKITRKQITMFFFYKN